MSAPLLAVDAPSMLYRAFYALPDSIKGADGKPVNALLGAANLILREVETHEPARGGPLLRPRRRRLPGRALPRLPRRRGRRCPTSWRRSGPTRRAFFERLRLDRRRPRLARGRRPARLLAELEAEAGGEALLLTGDRDMFQCATEAVTVLYVRTGRQGRRGGRPRRGRARATGSAPSWCPTSSPCAATPPTASRAPRASARRPPPSCCASTARSRRVLDGAIRETRPKLRTRLIGRREELLAFKDIATLRDAGVERPPDRADRRPAAPRRPASAA